MAVDTNPVFWERWEALGFAVVVQAIRDYANARRKLAKMEAPRDGNRYNYLMENGYYEKFFRSKYFGYICPKYDGHELFERLEAGAWMRIPKVHHYTPIPTYKQKIYIPVEHPKKRGRPRKYGSTWGQY
jgi:hypothetical protein